MIVDEIIMAIVVVKELGGVKVDGIAVMFMVYGEDKDFDLWLNQFSETVISAAANLRFKRC
ncbi:hypothetical protein Csa_023856 [Cucumis sativus]|nr:hypothetical protein Csa_023856 [Cucumis sativus]